MLAQFLNEPIHGYPLWQILAVLAAICVVSVIAWVILIAAVWRSDEPQHIKIILTVVIIAIGPLSPVGLLIELPIHLCLDLCDRLIRTAGTRGSGSSHSRRIQR